MKDRQTRAGDTSGYIPVVSPMLHGLAMTGVVFLRSSFGIVYLRPKSIFLSLGYAQLLFTVYACLEPGVFARHRAEVIFGTAATLLYVIHLLTAVRRAIKVTDPHDQYSGTSHLLRLLKTRSESAEILVQLWIEPVFVLVLSIVLRFFQGFGGLANWLSLVAVAMCCKEMINYWYQLRRVKRQEDIYDDTRDAAGGNASGTPAMPPLKASRKRGVKRARMSDEGASRFAEILKMNQPYTLEQASQNYRDLIKECHPDTHEGSDENTERTALLNEALEFFRGKFEDA